MNDSFNHLTKKQPKYTHCPVLVKTRKSKKAIKIDCQLGLNPDDCPPYLENPISTIFCIIKVSLDSLRNRITFRVMNWKKRPLNLRTGTSSIYNECLFAITWVSLEA